MSVVVSDRRSRRGSEHVLRELSGGPINGACSNAPVHSWYTRTKQTFRAHTARLPLRGNGPVVGRSPYDALAWL